MYFTHKIRHPDLLRIIHSKFGVLIMRDSKFGNVPIVYIPRKRPIESLWYVLRYNFFMSILYIYEGMEVATLAATLPFVKQFEDHMCDLKNCILVQNSSKMF